jgi:hypothetical protein
VRGQQSEPFDVDIAARQLALAILQVLTHGSFDRLIGNRHLDLSASAGGRLPADIIAGLDAWAAKAGVTRSEAMGRLIEAGLKRRPKA